jgi:hypothetical protein
MEEIFKGRLKNHNIEKSKQIDPYLNLFRQSLQVSQICNRIFKHRYCGFANAYVWYG